MEKQKVYIETSVISNLTARPASKETLKNKCFNTVAMPPFDMIYCAA